MDSSLLDINVDQLFEQHSITDINQIHKKLQSEVENKQEELRTMVGERYRDLLKAADTIGDMKSTSTNVKKNINDIIVTCRHMNDQQLIGFKSTQSPILNNNNLTTTKTISSRGYLSVDQNLESFYGISLQIKLLTQMPALLWSHMDKENYFIASQLYIFSRHLSTGLQLDTNSSIMKYFPVSKQLWQMLSPFFYTIKQICLSTLERQNLTTEMATICLASILILDNCSLEKLLIILIQSRRNTFEKILHEDSEHHERVQTKTLTSLKMLIGTLELIYKCFVESDDMNDNCGSVVKLISSVTSAKNAAPTISLVDMENSIFINTIPDIITKFKPHVKNMELSTSKLQEIMGNWLQQTSNHSRQQIKSVIDGVTSIKTINTIKQEAFGVEKSKNWQIFLQKLYLPANMDLYKFCYQPLISERVKEIILSSWENTIEQTTNQLELLTTTKLKESNFIGQSKWITEPEDIPLSLKQALSTEQKHHQLLTKSHGYTNEILKICQNFDENLAKMYNDLNSYLNLDAINREHNIQQQSIVIDSDFTDVYNFFQKSSRNGISQLTNTIKLNKNINQNNSSVQILLATFFKSLTELCPHLKLCLVNQNHHNSSTFNANSFKNWKSSGGVSGVDTSLITNQKAQTFQSLENESIEMWKKWVTLFVANLLTTDETPFAENVDFTVLTKDLLNWETVTIEEKDEQDKIIVSTIRVPANPTVSLQLFCHNLYHRLNQIVPYILRRTVFILLTTEITQQLHKIYQRYLSQEFVKSNQNASLQYYFDLQFIELIFTDRSNKELLDGIQTLTQMFKTNIDPFDFELFHKYLIVNVRRSVQRTQNKLGSIIPSFEHLTSVLSAVNNEKYQSSLLLTSSAATPNTITNQGTDPNVLALSTKTDTTGWFSLLPVMIYQQNVEQNQKLLVTPKVKKSTNTQPSSSSSAALSSSQQPQSQSLTSSSSSQNLANVKSGAAAFFGAMSQDWFR